jgi:hypothetical protein
LGEPRDLWMPPLAFGDAVGLSLGAAVFCAGLLVAIPHGTRTGLPLNDKLITISGRITYVGLVNGGSKGSHYTVFRLGNSPTNFSFGVGMGDYVAVSRALCGGCEASVWIDPNDRRPEIIAWQISVKGQLITNYSDIKAHWIGERQRLAWLASAAGIASLGFAFLAFLRWRWDQSQTA